MQMILASVTNSPIQKAYKQSVNAGSREGVWRGSQPTLGFKRLFPAKGLPSPPTPFEQIKVNMEIISWFESSALKSKTTCL